MSEVHVTTAQGVGLPTALWRMAKSGGFGQLGRQVAKRWPFLVLVTAHGGRRLYVDLRSSIGRGLFATGTFDIEAIQPVLDALTPGATFIDIGANIGFYSVLALDLVGSSGSIHCFEIDPRPLRALRRTISEFGHGNIQAHEAAISDVDGTLTFVPSAEHGHNRIDRHGGQGRKVRSVRLDSWVASRGLSRVDAIKIDVEGAERLVLEGARQTLLRFRPLVVCEAAEETAKAFGYTPQHLRDDFASLGYVTSWVDGVHTPTLVARPVI